jgi:hypothetical protein
VREKKNENDNREEGGIVLSASVDRVEMEGKSENTAKTSEGCGREGRPLLPLLQTTSPPSHLPRILPQVPVCCMMSRCRWSQNKLGQKQQQQNTALMIKDRHGVSKLSVFSLKKRMGKVNATLCFLLQIRHHHQLFVHVATAPLF